ncbi:TPA: hypothetical protein NII88_001338 [Pseudomonas aeruginosa]|nr:hypothetical protein [Pseudomonas aeruginosa]
MSLDEYNRHATLGSAAGPVTSASAAAGQEAYQRANEGPSVYAGPSAPFNMRKSLRTLAILVAITVIGVVIVAVLPESSSISGIAGFVAMVSMATAVILAIYTVYQAIRRGVAGAVSKARDALR